MNTYEEAKKQLIKTLAAIQSEEKMTAFLEALLTPREMEEMVSRLQIVKLLKQGLTQREIASRLQVGIATVTRGARELKNGKFSELD